MYLVINDDGSMYETAEPDQDDLATCDQGGCDIIRFNDSHYERAVLDSTEEEGEDDDSGIEPEGTIHYTITRWEKV